MSKLESEPYSHRLNFYSSVNYRIRFECCRNETVNSTESIKTVCVSMPKTKEERKGKQNVLAWGPSANSGLLETTDSNAMIMSLANCLPERLSGGNDQMNSIFHLIPLCSVRGDGNWCHWPSEAPLSAAPRRPRSPNGFRSRWGERQNNALFHNSSIPAVFTFSIQRNFDKFSMEILSLQVRMAAAAAAVDRVRFSALDAQARCITPFPMDENSIPSSNRLRTKWTALVLPLDGNGAPRAISEREL